MLSAMASTTRLVPFRGHETWVQITAPDDARSGTLPLFVLHGGPGMAHNYVRNIAELADETGRTVIRPAPSDAARSRSTGSRAPGRYSPIAIAVISRSVISSTRDEVSSC